MCGSVLDFRVKEKPEFQHSSSKVVKHYFCGQVTEMFESASMQKKMMTTNLDNIKKTQEKCC